MAKNVRSTINRIAKITILQMKKEELEHKIEEKFRKFDLRMRHNVRFIKEAKLIKKS